MTTIHFSSDLLFGSQIANTAILIGVTLEQIGTPDELCKRVVAEDVHGVLIDLSATIADLTQLVADLRRAAPAAIKVYAYGPHVQTTRRHAAEEAGCDQVMTRGQLHRELTRTLRQMDSAEPDATSEG